MNKQQLASKIWESANEMRADSSIAASEYKDYILGFMFYKFLSEQELIFCKDKDFSEDDLRRHLTEDDKDTVRFIQTNMGYFIAYSNLYSTWIERGQEFDISNVRDAISAFNRLIDPAQKRIFEGIFDTLEGGLSDLGTSTASQTKAARGILNLIKEIPMDNSQEFDVLGFVYEYLVGKFASVSLKAAGDFYTPHEVSELIAQIVSYYSRDKKEIRVYDPTSGSGGLLVNIGNAFAAYSNNPNAVQYYAQEKIAATYNLTRMNLVMRDIKPANITARNGDTLKDDWPYFEEDNRTETYEMIPVDAVVANPPYSCPWDPSDKENDPRYSNYGLAPKTKADYAFLLHGLYHLRSDGIMAIVLPHGVLFRGNEEAKIRKSLVERNQIQAVIGLPANMFYNTPIPTIIMILRKKRDSGDILIVDASKGFEKEGAHNHMRARDIKKVVDTVNDNLEIDSFSRLVPIEEIRANNYNLNIPRYVDSSEEPEHWDIYASMFGGVPLDEINLYGSYWDAWPTLREELFIENGTPYLKFSTDSIRELILENADVAAFEKTYTQNFENWKSELTELLVLHAREVEIASAENKIANDLFQRLEDVPLVDKYYAYQILDDSWLTIAADLEILQKEGMKSATCVDPNMVFKGKGKEEIQDGWVGRIIPFDLAQEELLSDEADKIKKDNERLDVIRTKYFEVIDKMSDEEKDSPVLNNNGDGFVKTEVNKVLKEAYSDVSTPEIDGLTGYIDLLEAKASSEEKLAYVDSTTEVDWSQIEPNKNGTYGKGKVQARIKELREKLSFPEDSFESQLLRVRELLGEETAIKKELKKEQAELHEKTKEVIEGLNEAQVKDLLYKKWIQPLVQEILEIPEQVVNSFVDSMQKLADKYAVTYSDITNDIEDAESSLLGMLDDLTGSDYDVLGIQEFKKLLGD